MTYSNNRTSMRGGFLHIKQLGFTPQTVIDVGAALGTFELYELFPRSHHVLIEPIAENEPYLAQLCHMLAKAQYIIAAATRKTGTATLQIAPELVHSSASVDQSAAVLAQDSRKITREVQAITLDQLCQDQQLKPPYLIKIDVDGNEVDVLMGAVQTLKQTEYVIVEVSLFNQIHKVIEFMTTQNFVIYDILDLAQRPEDKALWQADMAFVKADGRFRQNFAFTVSEQATAESTAHLHHFRNYCIQRIQSCYSDTINTNFLENLNLSAINLVAFPDWERPEELLLAELADLLRAIVTHPDSDRITLLLDSTGIEAETANLAISGAAMYLLSEEGLDVAAQAPNIVILSALHTMQWQMLLPHLTARIRLNHENSQAVFLADAQDLNQVSPDLL